MFAVAQSWITLFLAGFAIPTLGTYPGVQLTPGVLCTETDPDFHELRYPSRIAHCERNVVSAVKRDVAKAYDVPESEWRNYEFDHLIPLCVGGSNDIGNLWPEPLEEALKKDRLENQICSSLRSGEMNQDEALDAVHTWIQTHHDRREEAK